MVVISATYRSRGNYARNLSRSIRMETDQLLGVMHGAAIDLTSGTISTRELRRRGHPFARRGSTSIRTATPLLPINFQTGRLQRSLRTFRRPFGWQLQFTAPEAKFVLAPGGTKLMVPRKFWTEMRRRYDVAKRNFRPRIA